MNAEIQEILRQLHELRNYVSPVELLLANMEAQIIKNKAELERKIKALESRFEELLKREESRSLPLHEAPPCATRLAPNGEPPIAEISEP